MKPALLLAAALASALALLWQFAGRGGRAEIAAFAPLAAPGAVGSQSGEAALESANAPSVTARASLAPESITAPPPDALATNTVVRIEVLYNGSGRPVRAAKVFVGPPPTESLTDEQGVIELQVPEGSSLYDVRVNATDEGDPFVPYQRILEQVVLSGRNEIVVRVDRGVDLHGSVCEAASGRVVTGARVTYHGFGYRTQVESDADGSFVCVALLVNERNACPLSVECDGYLPTAVKPQAADLEPGASPLLVLLERGIMVSGRILDSEHKPVAGASLGLSTPAGSQATSDELGRFEFGGIQPAEHASIYVYTQSWSSPPVMEKSLDLGALTASRFDIELVVQNAIEVRVLAELPDGTSLDSSHFEVDWGDGGIPNVGYPELLLPPENAQVRVAPRGQEFQIRALARAPGQDDRSMLVGGSARISTDRSTLSPLEVRVRLAESIRLQIPPAPAGAPEFVIDEDRRLLGTFDVQLIDADNGQPIEGENRVVFYLYPVRPEYQWLSPGPGGWIRIWQRIGTRDAFVRLYDGQDERVTISIPRSGYAKAEWRLRTKL